MKKYELFYQKPYCCAIACLQMILFRHTGKVFGQEDMAWEFGVKISAELSGMYAYPFEHLTSHGNDEWVPTMQLADKLASFFEAHDIGLRAEAHPATSQNLANLEKWIVSNLERWSDLWVEYSLDEPGNPKNIHIHDSLIEDYDPKNHTVHLLDPNPRAKNRRQMSLSELKKRISWAYGKQTGIMLVESANI